MNAIQLMMEEHRLIERMLVVIRKYCLKILNHEPLDYGDFYKIIDFVRNYADKHHHNKEEELLFSKMGEELGENIKNGPLLGMLIEHDQARLYMQNLEQALQELEQGKEEAKLDIIANAVSYTHLLHRHIQKEDTAIYQFAQEHLSPESQKLLEEQCRAVEEEAQKRQIQKKYLDLVEELEQKVSQEIS